MSLEDRESKVVYAAAANLNQAANTVLLTFIAMKPVMLQRHGVIADAAAGLLAPSELKLRLTPVATGVAADIAGSQLDTDVARARGVGVYKDLSSEVRVDAGDTVTIAVAVDAGGVSTGHVSLEYWELPFAGDEIDAWVQAA